MTLGEKIKELRQEKGWSLRTLGEKIGRKSPAYMHDLEAGHRNPSEDVLEELAKVFGISVEELGEYDARPPHDLMKTMTEKNPNYAKAFRRVADAAKKMPADTLLERINKFLEEDDKTS